MRGGRRVEIPAQFFATASTLTYEVSPGVQVTIAMAAIDIPATEKANHEPTGSFARRIQSRMTVAPAAVEKSSWPVGHGRTITNRDLESSMQRRRESELAYENRRKELGLPSVEDSRRQAELEADSIRIDLEQRRVTEQQSENYWRERATALRTEMAAADAELAYLRARLDEGPWSNDYSSGWSNVFFSSGGVSFGNFGRGFGNPAGFPQGPRHRPNIFVAPNSGAQVRGGVHFGGGATRGQVFVNSGVVRPARPFGGHNHFSGNVAFPVLPVFGVSGQGYDLSYERSELITQFNRLSAARAGLNARWRELEDEARRAGAPPGWLRP
jgi:hypothetical protein